MKTEQIINVIKNADAALSVKAIVKYAGIDADTSEFHKISDACWELVQKGDLVAFDTRDQLRGGLFFDIKRFA